MVVPVVRATLGTFNASILSELPTKRTHGLRRVVNFVRRLHVLTFAALVASANVNPYNFACYCHIFTLFLYFIARSERNSTGFYSNFSPFSLSLAHG